MWYLFNNVEIINTSNDVRRQTVKIAEFKCAKLTDFSYTILFTLGKVTQQLVATTN